MRFDWQALGIEPRRTHGTERMRCPRCPDHRKTDKPLSLNHDTGAFFCHHCEWKGYAKCDSPTPGLTRGYKLSERSGVRTLKDAQPKPKGWTDAMTQAYRKPRLEHTDLTDKTLEYFRKRGIPPEVVRRNRIERVETMFQGKKQPALAFPYFRNGEVVNVQYRFEPKAFKLETGCELILYGLDDIEEGKPLYIVEGQIDKLSLEAAGYPNCVSLPNGGNVHNETRWLSDYQDQLAKATHFVLAGDNDTKGKSAMEEIARRLGVGKCWRVKWPDGCKDANDVLVKFGAGEVIEALENAKQIPIDGVASLSDLKQAVIDRYNSQPKEGVACGWPTVSDVYKARLGELTILTGTPGTGKSTFLDNLAINISLLHDWKFLMFMPEQGTMAQHLQALIRVHVGKPFYLTRGTERMSEQEMLASVDKLNARLFLVDPDDADLNVDGLLALCQAAVMRYGVNALIIDPWNELESSRPPNLTETEFIGQSLRKIKAFARNLNVHVFIVVHTRKLEKGKNGDFEEITPYDLAGSAHWFNKGDMIFTLTRVADKEIRFRMWKSRFYENGRVTTIDDSPILFWDNRSFRFAENATDFAAPFENREAIKLAELDRAIARADPDADLRKEIEAMADENDLPF